MKPVSVKVGNRRLLALAAFLRKLPRKRFDYSVWVGGSWKGAQDLSCGTTGCALGWAATMPQFRKLGLHITEWGSPRIDDNESPCRAASQLFGIEYGDAIHLFTPTDTDEENATPVYVAKKLEKFVKARSA